MAAIDLEIDLGDGGPPAKRETHERNRTSERLPQRFLAPEKITITSVPVAIVISYANISCLGCGADHKDHRGVFIEHLLSNKVRAMRRIDLKDIGPYVGLPRRVDIAPREAIPLCSDCFLIEKLFREAAAVATIQGDLFGDPAVSKPITEIAAALKDLHAGVELEEEL